MLQRSSFISVFLLITLLIRTGAGISQPVLPKPDVAGWNKIFEKHEASGTFVLYHPGSGQIFTNDSLRAAERFLPASTFKIPNSLIGLETGVISGPDEVFIWNGTDYGYQAWNTDLSLQQAFRLSAVWVYQEIAIRIGRENMEYWLKQCAYGNMLTGPAINTFWLNGDIRISPLEQVQFLEKLYFERLPFQSKNQAKVKELMLLEENDHARLYAKTGWAARVETQIGWFVGFVEKQDELWIFALNIDMTKPAHQAARIEISKEILKEEGIFE